MISSFYKKFSLNNLGNDRPNGQIATILILIMVVVLIFILTTVNLGQLSISSTNLSNVADSASLYMASQLASRANQISISLRNSCGNPLECCSSGWGWLSWIFVGVVVIIVTVATWGYGTPYVIAAATAAGAAAGVVAASFAGTSVLQGALQGAIMGAAIGGGATAGAEIGAGAGASGLSPGEVVGLAEMQATGLANELGVAAASQIAAYTTAGIIVGGSLATGTSLYNAYVADQNQAAAFAAASRMLNGLPAYDLVRESVLLQVFSQTVDDPNKDIDSDDLNGNGDVNEKVSHFLYWWGGRASYLKGVIPTLRNITSAFFKGTLPNFSSEISKELVVTEEPGYWGSDDPAPQIIGRLSNEGNIAKVAQGLNASFWDPNSADSFVSVVSGFNAFIGLAGSIADLDIDQLTSNWQTYISNFYNTDAGQIVNGKIVTDFYHQLGDLKNVLLGWKIQIIDKRNQLPSCKTGTFGGEECGDSCQPCYFSTYCSNDCLITDPPEDASPVPCKLDFTLTGASLDSNIDDEVTPALDDIDALIPLISNFQNAILQYVKDMQNTYAAHESGYGGLNPATYSWTDSRGAHSVKVQVGSYQLAKTIETSSSNGWSKTTCIRLANYSDNGSNSWVEITRQDPQSKDLKSGRVSLGMWNPFFSGMIKKKGKTKGAFYQLKE